jgi:hypothetical protein
MTSKFRYFACHAVAKGVVMAVTTAFLLSPPAAWAHTETKAETEQLEKAGGDLKQGQYIECYKGVCRVADGGHSGAQHIVGMLYEKGIGVGKNVDKAVEYYEKAARQGLADAQTRLGVMFRLGEGVAKNPKLAEKWLKKAAQQDVPEAQYHLGQMYLHGETTSPNINAASKWLQRAADQGFETAAQAMASLPKVKPITKSSKAGLTYEQGATNLRESWQGYADLTKTLKQIDQTAASPGFGTTSAPNKYVTDIPSQALPSAAPSSK